MHFLIISLFAIFPFFCQVNGMYLQPSNDVAKHLERTPISTSSRQSIQQRFHVPSKPNITQDNMGKYSIHLTSPKLLSNFSIYGEDANKHPEFTYGANNGW
ncbi:hypothetical protein BofuT4_P104460.1 [Botrytis cinerea T4]|uniref:Uncharacterized protein n=1 Tax=Botryotinia fuckeliana (strain T4) TaxID=999810 RepID=G2YAI9_BOTF4|nr:hypothetical protein BofuT4_P104460.1 [Botrytis cinerea T4]